MAAVDQQVLSQLLDQHSPALMLYAQQWCTIPEDVLQEAFIQLMRARTAPTNPVGWLYRVVRNRAIDVSRAAATRGRHEVSAAVERQTWFAPTSDDQLDAAAAVVALGRLPLEEREVIVLRLWSGMSFQEIGELIGRTTSTAHRRFEQGLVKLREAFNQQRPLPSSENHASQ